MSRNGAFSGSAVFLSGDTPVDEGMRGTRMDKGAPGASSETRVNRASPGMPAEMPCLQGAQSASPGMPVDKGLPGIPACPAARVARIALSAYGSGSGFAIK